MNIGKTIGLAALLGIATFVLFDVSFPFDISPSHETEIPDPSVEAQYRDCYQRKDQEMHEVAFGTIDNPDVQKEFISTNRERIARECRQAIPEQLITIDEPSRFNLVDLKPRFW